MRELRVDPGYIPPEIPGLVFATNCSKVDVNTGVVMTEATATKRCADWLGIPEHAVRTIRFNPTNSDSKYATAFASYIEKEYEDVLKKRKATIAAMAFLLELTDPYSELYDDLDYNPEDFEDEED